MRLSLKPSMNWFFVFVPVTVLLEHVDGIPVPVIFFSAALAILPIAGMIVRATEQIASRVGDTIGGLLNATFGNAPELIITLVALKAGLFDMVRASLAGAIMANLLLALGIAFVLGGIRYHEQEYNPVASRIYSTMMLIAVISMSIPSGFRRVLGGDEPMAYEQSLNLGVAVALLVAYLLSLLFMLKTHPDLFKSVGSADQHSHAEGERWSVGRAVITLVAGSVLAAWMSEILVGAAEGTGKALGMSETFIGIVFLAIVGGAAESGSAIATARKKQGRPEHRHCSRKLCSDSPVRGAHPRACKLCDFSSPLLAYLRSRRDPLDVSYDPDRDDRGKRRPLSLVQRCSTDYAVPGDGHDVLFSADSTLKVCLLRRIRIADFEDRKGTLP